MRHLVEETVCGLAFGRTWNHKATTEATTHFARGVLNLTKQHPFGR